MNKKYPELNPNLLLNTMIKGKRILIIKYKIKHKKIEMEIPFIEINKYNNILISGLTKKPINAELVAFNIDKEYGKEDKIKLKFKPILNKGEKNHE